MLMASSINGFLFGLVSGQPLLILGPTGPFLVFEEMVYDVNRKIFFFFLIIFFIVMPIIECRFLDSTMLC
jgi:MFS superfamily sulfate permease-like transporter